MNSLDGYPKTVQSDPSYLTQIRIRTLPAITVIRFAQAKMRHDVRRCAGANRTMLLEDTKNAISFDRNGFVGSLYDDRLLLHD